jgi:argininosuccinate synthase
MFKMTVSPEAAPDRPTYLEIEFAGGNPVALDGQQLEPLALFTRLNKLGGANGIGRLDLVENRFVGMKSRGVYETPGGTILRAAHRDLETTMDATQRTVNGTVRLKLYKGSCTPVGRTSDQSLYQESFATFEEDSVYDQADATGFIRLNGLRLRIQALQKKQS